MQNIRQMTQKGDPLIRVQLPEILIRMLKEIAKKNKRRHQDQLVKSLAVTFKNDAAFAGATVLNKIRGTDLERYAQIISSDMMEALKESAQQRGVSLDMEVALRLMTAMRESETFEGTGLLNQILNFEFSQKEAETECKRKRADNLYLFEMEKLRLYLRFEAKLPRNFRENFTVIDVKTASKKILAELKHENKDEE